MNVRTRVGDCVRALVSRSSLSSARRRGSKRDDTASDAALAPMTSRRYPPGSPHHRQSTCSLIKLNQSFSLSIPLHIHQRIHLRILLHIHFAYLFISTNAYSDTSTYAYSFTSTYTYFHSHPAPIIPSHLPTHALHALLPLQTPSNPFLRFHRSKNTTIPSTSLPNTTPSLPSFYLLF